MDRNAVTAPEPVEVLDGENLMSVREAARFDRFVAG